MAKGFEPTFFPKVDPQTGLLEARLKPRAAPSMPPSQIIVGRVLDPDKKPIANAVVSVEGTVIGNTMHGWPPEGTDPLAVTDEAGHFEIRCPKKFDAMHLKVEARGFARRLFAQVRPGPEGRDLSVTLGAVLSGTVMRNGTPVNNLTIGVAQVNRSSGEFVGDFVTGTGPDGRFVFPNLPPDRDYAVYGLMDSLKGIGALPTRIFRVKADGTRHDMGTLQVVPGWRLVGQVRLSDGKPIPAHTRLSVGREAAWDSTAVELPPDGRFSLTNVPGEVLSLSTRIPGYSFSAQNTSLDRLNPFRMMGRLNADKTNLTILLEPGEEIRSESTAEEERPDNFPLCGIEAKRVIPDAVLYGGRVLDANNQSPIPQFQVTPGRQRFPGSTWTEWLRSKSTPGTNGVFALELSAKGGGVVFMVEAPGYLSILSEPLTVGQTNCVLHLQKGHGPSGVVQLPDGTPLPQVKVLYLSGDEQANLYPNGEVRGHGTEKTRVTDAAGKFSFAPKIGQGVLIVAGSNGFAKVVLSAPGDSNTVTLLPWSRVRGRLVKSGKPLPQEHVDLDFDVSRSPQQPHLHLNGGVTDEQGRFRIENVPAGPLQLTTRVPMGQNSWTNQKQKAFTAPPGEEVDLGEVEKAEPSKR